MNKTAMSQECKEHFFPSDTMFQKKIDCDSIALQTINGVFVIYFIFSLISGIVFFVELIYFKIRKVKENSNLPTTIDTQEFVSLLSFQLTFSTLDDFFDFMDHFEMFSISPVHVSLREL
jgi:hypothetical protein